VFRQSIDDIELDEDRKREVQAKRVVIDKETGKAKEVDIYERPEKKKKDPESMKAIFSSSLEQSIMPSTISKFIPSYDSYE
jgi:hypothetical protein